MHRRFALVITGVLLALCPVVLRAQTTVIRGTVYDSVHQAPVVDATVVAIRAGADGPGMVSRSKTDARGAFEFPLLAAGRYTISVEHAGLDSAGIGIPDIDRTFEAGGITQLTLATPSRATRVRLACGGVIADTTLGAVLGTVADIETRRPIPHATLVLQWSDFSVDSAAHFRSQGRTASVTAGADGGFRACGIPAQRSIFLQAQLGQASTGIVEDQINEGGVLTRDFYVALAGVNQNTDRGIIEGVLADPSGKPVKSARVALVGTTRAVETNDAGHFRFDSLPLGTQQLEMSAVGFYPVRSITNVAGAASSVHVTMEPPAVLLDSMRTVASANNPMYREFEQRRKQGYGMFFTETDIAKKAIFDLSDFFMVMPHINAHVDYTGHRYFATKEPRGGSSFLPNAASRMPPTPGIKPPPPGPTPGTCQPAVIIDGTLSDVSELDAIPPRFVHGIEVYGGYDPVPAKYRGMAGGLCGAIIVWTK